MLTIGDRARFIGTPEQDVYHGALVGVVGIIRQIEPFVLLKPDYTVTGYGDGLEHSGLFDAGPSDGRYLEAVK